MTVTCSYQETLDNVSFFRDFAEDRILDCIKLGMINFILPSKLIDLQAEC